jgi:hypothetical protein
VSPVKNPIGNQTGVAWLTLGAKVNSPRSNQKGINTYIFIIFGYKQRSQFGGSELARECFQVGAERRLRSYQSESHPARRVTDSA